MRCPCTGLQDAIRVADYPQFVESLQCIERDGWLQLHQCGDCGQLWTVDVPDYPHSEYAVKIPSRDGWQSFDTAPARKQLLLRTRGGTTDEHCIWAGCEQPRVRGVVYCLDHLYANGARE